MPKKSFDWSTLTRIDIYDHMYSLKKLATKRLTVDDSYQLLANHVRKLAPLRVTRKQNYNVPRNCIVVSGQYNSDFDQLNQKCITITLLYSPFDKRIKLLDTTFINFCKEISDTILHEIIHMRQYRRRNFKYVSDFKSEHEEHYRRREQGYLGNRDEIDAFGFNIACELYDRYGSRSTQIEKYLNLNRPKKHNLYKYYLSVFNYDHDHPVIRKLKKKVINYLPLAEMGKPYKNNDWIWY